jgi:hypothetical protein
MESSLTMEYRDRHDAGESGPVGNGVSMIEATMMEVVLDSMDAVRKEMGSAERGTLRHVLWMAGCT